MVSSKIINIVTLGCSKNVVDSEVLMKQLQLNGWQILHDSNSPDAKIVVVNTCGFIADAKEESVDTIMSFVDAKCKGVIERLYVMGCLSERYRKELAVEIPEVDGFFGVTDLPQIISQLDSELVPSALNQRVITTPNHYAYLKISEGCNWGCSFCAIPIIRGKHTSRSIESLIEEAQSLANEGVKELLVIAQDSTYFGYDTHGKRLLPDLLNQLSLVRGIEWIRLHYAYPAGFPDELIDVIASNQKVCRYIDLPLQHISDKILKLMRRGITKQETIALVNKLRSSIPELAIRTTFLVGHPGEAEEDFQELINFVQEHRFERVGVFTYSEEEGTHSASSLVDNISQLEKDRRAERLMDVQRNISADLNESRIGRPFKVIIDRIDNQFIVGRTEFDSPEVDQEVLIRIDAENSVKPGDFVEVKIISAGEYDLTGTVINSAYPS